MKRIISPTLYQINTRVLINKFSVDKAATLDDVPDDFIDEIAIHKFDYVWLLGVWETGPLSRAVSARDDKHWRAELLKELEDLDEKDINASPFAIKSYTVSPDFGGVESLQRFRERLIKRNMKLILDFVPNHMGLDHDWIHKHPDYLMQGTEEDIKQQPQNYFRAGDKIFAHGRDPFFDGWADTVQINYRNPAARAAMKQILLSIVDICDGVRSDMCMLVLPSVFKRSWGDKGIISPDDPFDEGQSFWLETLPEVKSVSPDFILIAEVYWEMEWALQQQGFDFTYDKRLYDRLHSQDVGGIIRHLTADPVFSRKLVRFLENHDELRAATHYAPWNKHQAAAIVAFCVPGLHFFHHGQFEGLQSRISMHVGRAKNEDTNNEIRGFYHRLIKDVLAREAIKNGQMSLQNITQAWDGNPTFNNFISFTMSANQEDGETPDLLLIVVNYGGTQGQCWIHFDFLDKLPGSDVLFKDVMNPEVNYKRNVNDMKQKGLYFDMPAFGYHVFQFEPAQ